MLERAGYAAEAIDSLAFASWLRSGSVPDDLIELSGRLDAGEVEWKHNPYHDPANGRFTPGPAERRRRAGQPATTGQAARAELARIAA